jgi:hypothetical protein
MAGNVLYTDGHGVMITDSMFYVKKNSYRLVGIIKHNLSVIKPARLPWLLLFFFGMGMFVVSLIGVITPEMAPDIFIYDRLVDVNDIVFLVGWISMLIGLLMLAIVRERYAVTILTSEGKKDAVVSTKKEYVYQIVSALNKAFSLKYN